MKSLAIIAMIILVGSLQAQQKTDLRMRKNLRDQLDEIVFQYEQFSRFGSTDEINNFNRLFSQDALVFDYLTPNYLTRNTGQELIKEFDDFVQDVQRDFPKGLLQSRIVDTNLGEAINYDELDWSDPSVNILIRIKTLGEYAEGGQFSNDAVISLTVDFDTISGSVGNFFISGVSKVGSQLRYQKEERAPLFEKQIIAKSFYSWNNLIAEETDGDFYVSNPTTQRALSQSYALNLIKIISAPEPEEFSYSIGISYTQSNYLVEVDDFFYSYLTTDRENDAVYNNVMGEDIFENVSSEMIEVPLLFRYERKFSRFFSFFINSGLSLNYQFRVNHSGSGTFSYSGYYPKYDLAVTDVEAYGYLSNQTKAETFTIASQQFSRDYFGVSGTADIGFNLENKGGWVYYIGITAFKGIVNNKRMTDFNYITTELNEYNGLYPVVNNTNFGGYGAFFGVRKRFRSRNGLVKMENN